MAQLQRAHASRSSWSGMRVIGAKLLITNIIKLSSFYAFFYPILLSPISPKNRFLSLISYIDAKEPYFYFLLNI